MTNIAIIFAGGTGERLNHGAKPKQFLRINGKPIIVHTLELFQNHPQIDKIYIAIHPDWVDYMFELVKHYYLTKTAGICIGGATGQDSIYRALKLAAEGNSPEDIVLIHDGVRPNITADVISRNIECALKHGNAVTCTSCFETILISRDGSSPSDVPYRKNTFAAQAPQSFHLGEIIAAHEQMRKTNPEYDNIVDSCTLFNSLGKKTYMVAGNRGNIKITTAEDLYILRALIRYREDFSAFGLATEN